MKKILILVYNFMFFYPQMTQMYADIDSIYVDLRNLRIKLFILFVPGILGGELTSSPLAKGNTNMSVG